MACWGLGFRGISGVQDFAVYGAYDLGFRGFRVQGSIGVKGYLATLG